MAMIRTNKSDVQKDIEEFLDAARSSDFETLSSILASGLSPDVVDDDYTTALQIVAAQGNLRMMDILLDGGASVDKCNDCGYTPLLHAARNGKAEAVELLIRNGADPRRTTFYGTTALSLAAAGGHINVVVVLRKYKSQTRRRAPSPLIAAIAKQQYQLVIYFELTGITKHPCLDKFYELDAYHTAKQLQDAKLTRLLHDFGLQTIKQPSNHFASTTFTEKNAQARISRKTVDIRCLIRDHKLALLNHILDLNGACYELPEGTTPLMYAAIVGDVFMAQSLLQRNCDLNVAYHGFTPLMIAIVCGNDALTRYFLKQGADPSTNGYRFSLFELASNSDGISPTTLQLIPEGSKRKWCCIGRMSAKLKKFYKWGRIRKSTYRHQTIQIAANSSQPSFQQKVIHNLGLKSDWVPKEVFDALAWPSCSCKNFQGFNPSISTKVIIAQLSEDRINEMEQNQYNLLDECKLASVEQEVKKANTKQLRKKFDKQKQQCCSISKLQSRLFHFGPESPKNVSYSTSSSLSSTDVATYMIPWPDDEKSVLQNVKELYLSYEYEGQHSTNFIQTEIYRDLLNIRCSPDVCQKFWDQEVDYETFLMLNKAEFISLGISRTDADILRIVQRILRKQLSTVT